MTSKADLDLAHRLAEAAGEAIRPYFRARYEIETKGDQSPVTQADQAAEAAMRAILEKERPQDGIIGEEYGAVREGASRVWILDPIDGTRSFIAGRPIFGTLIALMQEGWPTIGIIDQPIIGERWSGMTGQPTLMKGQPVRTRACRALDQAILGSTGPQYFPGCKGEHFSILAGQCRDTVWGGDCYNYALLASGHMDIVCEAGLKLYDIAALVPVVEGAGGHMCDWQGNPLDSDSQGDVVAMGDIARLDDILEALAHGHEGH